MIPGKFTNVKMPRCRVCDDSGWRAVPSWYVDKFTDAKERAAAENTVEPCTCDEGMNRTGPRVVESA